VLQGKDKPSYNPHSNCGDVVVVVNAGDVVLTGNKLRDKLYKRHTGYPGGLRQRTAQESLARDPTSLLRAAVLRMLPKNLLQDDRARKLRLFAEPQPGGGLEKLPLVPLEMPPRQVRRHPFGLPEDFELPEGWLPLNPDVEAKRLEHVQKQKLAAESRRRAKVSLSQPGPGQAGADQEAR